MFVSLVFILAMFFSPDSNAQPTLNLNDIARNSHHDPRQCPINLTGHYCHDQEGGNVIVRVCKKLSLKNMNNHLVFTQDLEGSDLVPVSGRVHHYILDGRAISALALCENGILAVYRNAEGIGWFETAMALDESGNALFFRSRSNRGDGVEEIIDVYTRVEP